MRPDGDCESPSYKAVGEAWIGEIIVACVVFQLGKMLVIASHEICRHHQRRLAPATLPYSTAARII